MARKALNFVSPMQQRQFDHASGLERYTRVEKAGDGAYGAVYKCLDNETRSYVALKKIKMDVDDSGIPPTAMREITLLRHFTHPNVVFLHRVLIVDYRLYLVFEYLELDLKKFMDTSGPLSTDTIKSFTAQMFEGLAYCHSKGVMHRDLKPQNLLVSNGKLKLADFGLARSIAPSTRPLTMEVITRWYRPPEILLGQQQYTMSVDIWSVGCIIVELFTKCALFPGKNELEQLHFIFNFIGTPTLQTWPGVRELPFWRPNFPHWVPKNLGSCFPMIEPAGVALIEKTLSMDPEKRITAIHALRDPFIANYVSDLTQFPLLPAKYASPVHNSHRSGSGLENLMSASHNLSSNSNGPNSSAISHASGTVPTVTPEIITADHRLCANVTPLTLTGMDAFDEPPSSIDSQPAAHQHVKSSDRAAAAGDAAVDDIAVDVGKVTVAPPPKGRTTTKPQLMKRPNDGGIDKYFQPAAAAANVTNKRKSSDESAINSNPENNVIVPMLAEKLVRAPSERAAKLRRK